MGNPQRIHRLIFTIIVGLMAVSLSSAVYAQAEETPQLVSDLDWSPDGSRIALGIGRWRDQVLQESCDDTNILIMDIATERLNRIPYPVEMSCSPSGVDFGTTDSSILLTFFSGLEIWNLVTERRITSSYAEAYHQAASYSPDGSEILVTLWPGVEIEDLSLRNIIHWFSRPSLGPSISYLYSTWSPDGTRVVSSMDDGRIYVWSAENEQLLATFEGHSAPVKRLAWNPMTNVIASGDDSGIIWIWDAATGEPIRQLSGHRGIVYDLAWNPNGQELASAGADNTLRVWNVASGAMRIVDSSRLFSAVAYSPDGTRLAYAGAYSAEAAGIEIIPAVRSDLSSPSPTFTPTGH